MTTPRRRAKPLTVTAWQRTPITSVLRGPVRVIHPALKLVDCPYQWDAKISSYLLPARRLDDVLAAIELDGHHVQLELAPW